MRVPGSKTVPRIKDSAQDQSAQDQRQCPGSKTVPRIKNSAQDQRQCGPTPLGNFLLSALEDAVNSLPVRINITLFAQPFWDIALCPGLLGWKNNVPGQEAP
eukprot:1161716-Pelagomonas_calceolata.AAC.9